MEKLYITLCRYFCLFFSIILCICSCDYSYAQAGLHAKNVKFIMNGGLDVGGRGLTHAQRDNIEKAIRKQVEANKIVKQKEIEETARNNRLFSEWEKNNANAANRLYENSAQARHRVEEMSGVIMTGVHVKVVYPEDTLAVNTTHNEDSDYSDLLNSINTDPNQKELELEKDFVLKDRTNNIAVVQSSIFVPIDDNPVRLSSGSQYDRNKLLCANLMSSEFDKQILEDAEESELNFPNLKKELSVFFSSHTIPEPIDSIQMLVLDSMVVAKYNCDVCAVHSLDSIETLLTLDIPSFRLYPNDGISFFIVINSNKACSLLLYMADSNEFDELIRLPQQIDNLKNINNVVFLFINRQTYVLTEDLQLKLVTL